MEPEHRAEADGHIGIAGEIVIDLHGVEQRAHPRERRGNVLHRETEDLVRPGGKRVREDHLFGKPVQKAPDAVGDLIDRLCATPQRCLHVGVAHDRSRDELREKADVQRERKPVLLRFDLAAIQVNHIAQRLERIEADAERKRNVTQCDRPASRQRVDGRCEKIEVFEIAEQPEVDRNGYRQRRAAALFQPVHGKAGQPVDRDGRQHQYNVSRLAPPVEQKACKEQQRVFRTDAGHDLI